MFPADDTAPTHLGNLAAQCTSLVSSFIVLDCWAGKRALMLASMSVQYNDFGPCPITTLQWIKLFFIAEFNVNLAFCGYQAGAWCLIQ